MNQPNFRAWHERLNLMCNVINLDFKNEKIIVDHETCGESVPLDLSEIILMQSTGLKDKNGVEIFEGDIIASQNKNRKNWYASHHEVVWHDTGFMGKQICSSSFIGLEHWTKGENGYVVIGNIHENPELLNEVE